MGFAVAFPKKKKRKNEEEREQIEEQINTQTTCGELHLSKTGRKVAKWGRVWGQET